MAPSKKTKKLGVKLEDLMFYFDGVERDRIDASGASRKSGEVLALRDRLLKMPDDEFDATIKTVKGLLVGSKPLSDEIEGRAQRRSQASQLFDQTQNTGGGSAARSSKVAPA